MSKKALIDLTDKELEQRIRAESEHVIFSYDAYVQEIERRSQDRHSTAIKWLTAATVFVGLVAALAALLAVFK